MPEATVVPPVGRARVPSLSPIILTLSDPFAGSLVALALNVEPDA